MMFGFINTNRYAFICNICAPSFGVYNVTIGKRDQFVECMRFNTSSIGVYEAIIVK